MVVREHIEAELPAVDGGMSLQTLIFKKCLERFPKIHTGENDRNIPYFSCLYKRGDLKKFIKRAESARIENICFRRERERRFAREKIIKRKRIGDVWIQHLFMGQLDIESDRMAARLLCALVGGFHDTGTAAGNDCITQFGDLECEFVRVFVVLVRRCETCRSIHSHRFGVFFNELETAVEFICNTRGPVIFYRMDELLARVRITGELNFGNIDTDKRSRRRDFLCHIFSDHMGPV